MKPKDLITKVQRISDTSPKRSQITATDVSRVISQTFQVIASLSLEEALPLLAKLVANGKKAKVSAKAKKAKAK